MNFFKLYIGDYQRDTAHLSVTEHGAYLLMLQHYYATERPLPTGKALHRMLRVQDRAERDAVDAVAAQFWRTTEAGLVNDRADAEINKARVQAEVNRTTAQAREAARKAARAKHEGSTNRATDRATDGATNDQPNHSHSHSQTALGENTGDGTPTVSAGASDRPPPTPGGLACAEMRKAGIPAHLLNPEHAELLAALAAGVTPIELGATAAEMVASGKPIHMAYIIRAATGRRRDSAAQARANPRASISTPLPAPGSYGPSVLPEDWPAEVTQ